MSVFLDWVLWETDSETDACIPINSGSLGSALRNYTWEGGRVGRQEGRGGGRKQDYAERVVSYSSNRDFSQYCGYSAPQRWTGVNSAFQVFI